jgi:hypothetical protein
MSARTENPWIQTGTGRALDLMAPTAAMIDLDTDVAEALAREPRFGGHVRGGPYSVAQHMVLGADAIVEQTGSIETARAFILHDAHEYACKDIMTPLAKALDLRVRTIASARVRRVLPTSSQDEVDRISVGLFHGALHALKADLDRAIHAAAGHPWPLAPEIAKRVAEWDLAMLAAERRHLLAPSPQPWDPAVEDWAPAKLKGRIQVWPWPKAADEWRARLHSYFPHLAAAKRAA